MRSSTGFGSVINRDIDVDLVDATHRDNFHERVALDPDNAPLPTLGHGEEVSMSNFSLGKNTGFGSVVNMDIDPEILSAHLASKDATPDHTPEKGAASPADRKTLTKKSSILGSLGAKQEPKPASAPLPTECFEIIDDLNVPDEEAAELLARSCSQADVLVGWQIEMFRSSNPDYTLGIYVITDVKKAMMAPTKYLLRGDPGNSMNSDDEAGIERWTFLKRGLDKSGKPFRLLRKVL